MGAGCWSKTDIQSFSPLVLSADRLGDLQTSDPNSSQPISCNLATPASTNAVLPMAEGNPTDRAFRMAHLRSDEADPFTCDTAPGRRLLELDAQEMGYDILTVRQVGAIRSWIDLVRVHMPPPDDLELENARGPGPTEPLATFVKRNVNADHLYGGKRVPRTKADVADGTQPTSDSGTSSRCCNSGGKTRTSLSSANSTTSRRQLRDDTELLMRRNYTNSEIKRDNSIFSEINEGQHVADLPASPVAVHPPGTAPS
eukprot:TRINITY_DN40691_c0_g1_i1.p1 TRINITY_DN40691_c0_g1~~TRINITY_DN40691_c0_g1_i1.p1  ORF type:complete len:268 (-),score=25.58 TRINITY_DN40691_c0_g1_i1:39-806(-)